MEEKYIIFCDGGSRGNPGPAASAFVVVGQDNKLIYKEGKYLGIETNNVAEYSAVLLALNWLIKNSLTLNFLSEKISFRLDSQLVERQLNGLYRVKDIKLKKLFDEIKKLIQEYNLKITFIWSYRDKNILADSLVNKTLDDNLNS